MYTTTYKLNNNDLLYSPGNYTAFFPIIGYYSVSAAAAAAKSVQSCLTLSNPMDCSLPGSSIHGIFQARVLKWGAIAFSEKEYRCIHMYINLHHFAVHWKLQYCKSTILQLKPKKLTYFITVF